MKKKIILLAVALSFLNACTNEEELDPMTTNQTSKTRGKERTSNRATEKTSIESDSIKASAAALNELADDLNDGGDPKDVPPRRINGNSTRKTDNKSDSIRISSQSSKEGSDKIEDGGDPKDVPPRR